MKIITCAVLATALTATASAEVSFLDNNKTVTIDCAKDKVVNLIGNHITVTLKGTCTKVSITGNHETVTGSASVVYVAGNHNTLSIDAADAITLAGDNNTVSWKRGNSKKQPAISNVGKGNNVTQAP